MSSLQTLISDCMYRVRKKESVRGATIEQVGHSCIRQLSLSGSRIYNYTIQLMRTFLNFAASEDRGGRWVCRQGGQHKRCSGEHIAATTCIRPAESDPVCCANHQTEAPFGLAVGEAVGQAPGPDGAQALATSPLRSAIILWKGGSPHQDTCSSTRYKLATYFRVSE